MGLCCTKLTDIPITSGPVKLSSQSQPQQPPKTSTQSQAQPPSLQKTPTQPPPTLPKAPTKTTSLPITSAKSSIPSLQRSTTPSKLGRVLEKPMVDVNSFFILEKELGRGQFGVTYLCTERSTKRKYACKSVSKQKLVSRTDVQDMRREIMILQHLTGQPNIVEFKGAYEDENSVHLVMELCEGGELFDRIIAKGTYSEKEAAALCRDIVNVVHVCHFMGIIHRDLKPENFLLVSRNSSEIKATDFGLSVFIEEGKVYKELVGSAYYVAPEVLKRNYGKEIDVWSAGVILYILLCGMPPFWAGSIYSFKSSHPLLKKKV